MYSEEFQKPQKKLGSKEAKLKAADYCAYQERSQQEVRDKLYSYGLHKNDVEEIISDLITENFINEERFAIAYVGGKFRIKKWGRIKIMQGLMQHKISTYCIKKGMAEIDEEIYISTLVQILERKKSALNIKETFILNQKVAQFAIQKGYEPALVWELLKS